MRKGAKTRRKGMAGKELAVDVMGADAIDLARNSARDMQSLLDVPMSSIRHDRARDDARFAVAAFLAQLYDWHPDELVLKCGAGRDAACGQCVRCLTAKHPWCVACHLLSEAGMGGEFNEQLRKNWGVCHSAVTCPRSRSAGSARPARPGGDCASCGKSVALRSDMFALSSVSKRLETSAAGTARVCAACRSSLREMLEPHKCRAEAHRKKDNERRNRALLLCDLLWSANGQEHGSVEIPGWVEMPGDKGNKTRADSCLANFRSFVGFTNPSSVEDFMRLIEQHDVDDKHHAIEWDCMQDDQVLLAFVRNVGLCPGWLSRQGRTVSLRSLLSKLWTVAGMLRELDRNWRHHKKPGFFALQVGVCVIVVMPALSDWCACVGRRC